ncbi:CoA transferase [Kitasatospora sp. MAP5-34]|uniref:CoA transferase n=1 Tax=Kitasatospora sp. MAP5-34 TaxID=3035102 RepID=UPI002476DFE7|nr:CoA transferase [Kitasatospora sp. MAP5-34]MDH6578824.1 crotonobetainyl-CoA:carnitine CoA-transferase CaiB-like acyl-CoA transferase [Kitasatospora sp. MAP5-34]
MSTLSQQLLDEAWACLGGLPERTASVRWTGPQDLLPSRLEVAALAGASVAAAALAAADLAAVRDGGPAPAAQVDAARVATAFASDRALRLDGQEQVSWSPLSRFWRSSDGWVRTHSNYAHHEARLLDALGVRADAEDPVAAVEHAIAARTSDEVAETVTAHGGLAVAVRSAPAWAEHAQGAAVAALPLLTLERFCDAPVTPLTPSPHQPLRPAAGLRVLDLTRVIAGPVATRTLALLGADVLRIDSPGLPEITAQHLDTGAGKRSTFLDLEKPSDLDVFEELLTTADVVVTGYRPDSLDRFGLDARSLLARRPALVVASLSAWSLHGPWSRRRAFDSVVQAACGIADLEAAPDGTPGAMPVQALDHATGYLLAAAVLRAVARRAVEGGGWYAELSLAQTAAWLLRQPVADVAGPRGHGGGDCTAERATDLGTVRYALSPVQISGGPEDWTRPVGRPGADAPGWQ